MQEAMRTYLELAMGLTETSRKKVRKVVKEAVGRSGATADQVKTLTGDLLAANSANREALSKLVKFEVDRALGVVGLATADEVGELTHRVRDLERQLREAEGSAAPAKAAPGKRAAKVTAAKSTATKSTATKSTATKSAPTKSTAAKSTATKSSAKKTTAAPATKAVAKKTVAKKAVAKKAVAARKATPARTNARTNARVGARSTARTTRGTRA